MDTIEIVKKNECCGCGSCMQKCPKNAISMTENEEGFLVPIINKKSCVNCGLCTKVCPQLKEKTKPKENYPQAYAVYNKNTEELLKSSSGGMFSVIANYVLENNGIVFGAAYNNNNEVNHIYVENKEDLQKLRNSKYVQSNINNTYKEVEKNLKENRLTLFTGTPCQVAGLKAYLMKDYKNLILVDIVCHGVPNQKVFKKYLEHLEGKFKSKIKAYNFRNKEQNGWGLYAKIETEDGEIRYKNSAFDPYYSAFLECKMYRESCYNCHYTSFYRNSDITLADYWGILNAHPEFYSEKGVSLVLINNNKGKELLNKINENIEYIKTDLEKASQKNMNLKRPSNRPKERDYIYNGINEKSSNQFIKENLKITYNPKKIIKAIVPYKVKLAVQKVRSNKK